MSRQRQHEEDRVSPITLIGAPVEAGASAPGAGMGPAALRTAGLGEALERLGHVVHDGGDLTPESVPQSELRALQRRLGRSAGCVAGWNRALSRRGYEALASGSLPLFLGGDHSLSMGTVDGVARYCREVGRELFVLWLDAHADFNTASTSPSGNLHGMSLAMLCGEAGFDGMIGEVATSVDPRNVCVLGARSIDPGERDLLLSRGCEVVDMRRIDQRGVESLLDEWLAVVTQRDGVVHVSLDVDFLDPELAPGVGTTVPGGVNYRESRLVMERLHESERVISVDAVELNPFLDVRGQSARLMVELLASLLGRQVFPRAAGRFSAA